MYGIEARENFLLSCSWALVLMLSTNCNHICNDVLLKRYAIESQAKRLLKLRQGQALCTRLSVSFRRELISGTLVSGSSKHRDSTRALCFLHSITSTIGPSECVCAISSFVSQIPFLTPFPPRESRLKIERPSLPATVRPSGTGDPLDPAGVPHGSRELSASSFQL